jgi:hypothetical protein
MIKAALRTIILILSYTFLTSAQTIQTDIPALSKGADLILTGKVMNQKSGWNQSRTAIFTRVTIQVEEYIKGTPSQKNITVIHPGGEVDGIGELYTHIPTFEKDEQVLLFAKKHFNQPDYAVYQGEMGKMTLYSGKSGEKETVNKTKLSTIKERIKKSLSDN